MKSSFSSGFRFARSAALRGLACSALVASWAHACPIGTMPDPNYNPSAPAARAHPRRCVPAPKPPTAKYIGTTNPDIEHASRLHSQTPMQQDHSKLKPQPGAPIERANSVSNTHGILSTTGNAALNTQPIPPGKAALNPQPIPPGHALHQMPQPGAPIKKIESH
ncbi:hypothetical protein [Rudaea cellulosilytica]|uniref:hypothetical protein n=1 Tax=Rudaea cellulosilytica TaxID=540746 RepID=UPI00035DE550|nr:hypothetical protein [Rudaea cellulosilytica]